MLLFCDLNSGRLNLSIAITTKNDVKMFENVSKIQTVSLVMMSIFDSHVTLQDAVNLSDVTLSRDIS